MGARLSLAQQRPRPRGETHKPPAPTQPLATSFSSFQLLSLLPPPVLALIASHLRLNTLLHLQRCSSSLYRLRLDGAYMAVAWRRAEMRLSSQARLHEWVLPWDQCIAHGHAERLIPVSAWRAALPVLRAVLAGSNRHEEDGLRHRLHHLVVKRQPTKWVLAKRTQWWYARWEVVDDERAQQSADMRRVEVLRDVTMRIMIEEVLPYFRNVEVRCRFMLQVCPYLQHLDLTIDTSFPPERDTFTLVPRLRSLRVAHYYCRGDVEWKCPFDTRGMLDSLPYLTSFSCNNIRRMGVEQLLDIASHSTLEDVHIDSGPDHALDYYEWIGRAIKFPISVKEDEERLGDDAKVMNRSGDIEEEGKVEEAALFGSISGGGEGERQDWEMKDEVQRMRAALTRTQPTQRSCDVRLALADWLHRRLRRGRLCTDDYSPNPPLRPKSLLRRYRIQVALLRYTLRQQLTELAIIPATESAEREQRD